MKTAPQGGSKEFVEFVKCVTAAWGWPKPQYAVCLLIPHPQVEYGDLEGAILQWVCISERQFQSLNLSEVRSRVHISTTTP